MTSSPKAGILSQLMTWFLVASVLVVAGLLSIRVCYLYWLGQQYKRYRDISLVVKDTAQYAARNGRLPASLGDLYGGRVPFDYTFRTYHYRVVWIAGKRFAVIAERGHDGVAPRISNAELRRIASTSPQRATLGGAEVVLVAERSSLPSAPQ